MPSRRLLLVALIAFAAAIAGVFVGRMVSDAPKANETELHALLHGELDLTTEQEAKLERIEADFSGRRRALELEMRAANVRLAQAIDRKSVGSGKGVSGRVDFGGRLMLKKKNEQQQYSDRRHIKCTKDVPQQREK